MQLPTVVPHGLPVIAVVDAVLDSGTNNTFVLSVGLHIMVYAKLHRLSQRETLDVFVGEVCAHACPQGFADAFNEEFKKSLFVAKS